MANTLDAPGDVILLLSEREAKTLTALLYTCVGGVGQVRDDLDSISHTISDAVGVHRLTNTATDRGYLGADFIKVCESSEVLPDY